MAYFGGNQLQEAQQAWGQESSQPINQGHIQISNVCTPFQTFQGQNLNSYPQLPQNFQPFNYGPYFHPYQQQYSPNYFPFQYPTPYLPSYQIAPSQNVPSIPNSDPQNFQQTSSYPQQKLESLQKLHANKLPELMAMQDNESQFPEISHEIQIASDESLGHTKIVESHLLQKPERQSAKIIRAQDEINAHALCDNNSQARHTNIVRKDEKNLKHNNNLISKGNKVIVVENTSQTNLCPDESFVAPNKLIENRHIGKIGNSRVSDSAINPVQRAEKVLVPQQLLSSFYQQNPISFQRSQPVQFFQPESILPQQNFQNLSQQHFGQLKFRNQNHGSAISVLPLLTLQQYSKTM